MRTETQRPTPACPVLRPLRPPAAAIHQFVAVAGAGALCQATLTLAPADSWSWEANTAAQAAAMQQGLMAQMGISNPLAGGGGGGMLPDLPSTAAARQQQQQQQQAMQPLSLAHGGDGDGSGSLAGMSPLPAMSLHLSLQAPLSLAHLPSGPLFSAAMAGLPEADMAVLPEADMIPGLPDLSCFLDPGHA